MTTTVQDAPERSRYELHVDGELIGVADYTHSGDVRDVTHTEVDERHRGKGLASELVRHVVDDVRERGLVLRPTCPFVRSWLQKNPAAAGATDEAAARAPGAD